MKYEKNDRFTKIFEKSDILSNNLVFVKVNRISKILKIVKR